MAMWCYGTSTAMQSLGKVSCYIFLIDQSWVMFLVTYNCLYLDLNKECAKYESNRSNTVGANRF